MVTPVDLAGVYAACVTGVRQDMTLVKGIWESEAAQSGEHGAFGKDGKFMRFCDTVPERVLDERTVARLREMMCACVKIGTGWQANPIGTGISVGGKTATAQSGQYKAGKEILNRFFAGFYPADEPEYILVILCDGNGDNKAVPAKIFSEFIKASFSSDGKF